MYHYLPPKNWMNDPKPFFHKGEYHVFHQYNPNAPFGGPMHWGHAVSRDLAHWERLPIALTPTPDSPDEGGCWTGCAVEDDGVFHILYTGVHPQTQCLATSRDLIAWKKHKGNPVIATPPEGFGDCWRDPCAWKEGDTWYLIFGSEKADVGGAALLYRSKDLMDWKYLHPLFTGDKAEDGSMFECPDFFPLGGRHVLLTSWGVTYWHSGRYEDHRFTSEKQGVTDGGNFYAAKTLLDGAGRRILWGWVTENRTEEEMRAAGWNGVLSLPRVLGLRDDGTLSMTPPPELNKLRGRRLGHNSVTLGSSVQSLDGIRGHALEMLVRFGPTDAQRVGVLLRCTDDRSEGVSVYVEREASRLVAEGIGRATVRRVESLLEPMEGEEIELHIYLDHSVVEVFANGRACLTARPYTKRPDAVHTSVFITGGRAECTLDAWEMTPIW
jgi:beta-fructofuranosidase